MANDFARELLLGSEIILTVGIIFKGGTISFRGKLFEGRENYFCFFFLKWGTMIWSWGANNYFKGGTLILRGFFLLRAENYFKFFFLFKGGRFFQRRENHFRGDFFFDGGQLFQGGNNDFKGGKIIFAGDNYFQGQKNCSRGEMISRVEHDFLRGGKDFRRRTWSYFCSTWISCNASSVLRSDFLGPVCGAELKITSEPQRNPVALSESTEITKFDIDEIRHQI